MTQPSSNPQELLQLNRALKTLSAINQALIRATEESELLQRVCQIMVTTGGYRLAWVGFAQHDAEKSVVPVAKSGEDLSYLDHLQVSWADNEFGHGPTGMAIRTGQPQINRDTTSDPNYLPWREAATKRGYASSIALPLIGQSEWVGVLCLYADAIDAFDAAEVSLLQELADDLVYGITALRTRQDHLEAEEALRQSEERWRMAVEAAHMGLWNWNITTGEIKWSNEHEELFGLTPGSFDGQYDTFLNYIHAEDRDSMQEVVQQAMQEKSIYHHEFRVVWQDGSIHWIEGRGQFYYDESGQPIRMTGTVLDIDQRKQVEAMLHQSEAKYRLLFADNPNPMWVYDCETLAFLAVNEAAILRYGYSRSEFLSMTIADIRPDKDVSALRTTVAHVAQQHYSNSGEWRHRRKDGTLIDVEVTSNAINWEGIAARCVLAIDITDRKQAEVALREREMRYQLVSKATNDVIWDWNLITNQVEWNVSLETLFGYAIDQVPAQPEWWYERLHPDDRERVTTQIKQAIYSDQQVWQGEYRFRRMDGTYAQVIDRGFIAHDDMGNPIRMIGSMMDITEREQVKQELQASRELLDSIFGSLEDLVWSISMNNDQVLFISPAAEKVYGRSPTEFFQNPHLWLEVIHPDDRQVVEAAIENCLITGYFSIEYRIFHTDGSIRWIHDRGRMVNNAAGKPIRRDGIAADITQRKQMEQALHQSEERWELAIAGTNDGIWDYDLTHDQQFFLSPQGFAILGYEIDQIATYDQWVKHIHPDDVERVQNTFQQHLDQETRFYICEYRMQCADKSYKWLLVRGKALWNADGKPIRAVGSVTDITDRKQIETALQQTKDQLEIKVAERTTELTRLNDRLQQELRQRQQTQKILQKQAKLLDLAHDTIMVLDLNYTITFWNHGAEVMYGWSKAEALGQVVTDLLHTQFSKPIDQVKIELFRVGYWEGELAHVKRDGTVVIVASRWVLQRDAADQPVAILEINNDITHHKRVEAALRESEERFRSAFDHAPIGMAIVGLEGKWLQVNTALCEIVGYSEAELLSTTFHAITHPEDLSADINCIETLLNGEVRFYELEKRYFHKQGHVIWVWLSASLMRDVQGNPLYFIAQIQDITARREVERMKSEFISIVSHELRTPLTSIRGSLGLLASGALDQHPDRAHRMIEIAAIDIERLVRLVNDILDLERLESGKVTITFDRCFVENLMVRSVDAVRSLANKENITLCMSPISNELQVWASPDHIIQTLTNLLGNAIKFSLPNSTIWLSATPFIDPHPPSFTPPPSSPCLPPFSSPFYVRFCIKDQGRGIPTDKLETIFGRFQQVDASDSRRKGGTGLGLAICQSIVQQHGGKIWVESQLAEGSSFYFTLPVSPENP